MFIVLSIISKDVVDLWEAVITFLMFPLVVILAFLVGANVPASQLTLDDLSLSAFLGREEFLRLE